MHIDIMIFALADSYRNYTLNNNFRHIQSYSTILNSIHSIFAVTLGFKIKLVTLKLYIKYYHFRQVQITAEEGATVYCG